MKRGDPLKLLTKDNTLTKQVGDAHKGWVLVCVSDTTHTIMEQAAAEAREKFKNICQDTSETEAHTFIFGRRTLFCKHVCLCVSMFEFSIVCAKC